MRPLSKTGSFIYSLALSSPFLDILKSRCNLSDPKISVHKKLMKKRNGTLIAGYSKTCWTVARHAYSGSFDSFYSSKPLATTTANSTDCNWLVPTRLHLAHGSTRGRRAEDSHLTLRSLSLYPFLLALYLLYEDDWGRISWISSLGVQVANYLTL